MWDGTYLPDVGDLLLVSEEATSPNHPLTVFSRTSGALSSYLLFYIEDRCMMGDLDLE